jgi:hypothetical protein
VISRNGRPVLLPITHGDPLWRKYYANLLKHTTEITGSYVGPRRARRIALMMIEFGAPLGKENDIL